MQGTDWHTVKMYNTFSYYQNTEGIDFYLDCFAVYKAAKQSKGGCSSAERKKFLQRTVYNEVCRLSWLTSHDFCKETLRVDIF